MTQWTKTVPGTAIPIGGKDVPLGTPHFDPKQLVAEHTASIRKANPHHDAKGRFTSADSAAAGSVSGALTELHAAMTTRMLPGTNIEVETMTTEHGTAQVYVRGGSAGSIEIDQLRAESRGAGRAALQRIVEVADKHVVAIDATVVPSQTHDGFTPSIKQLTKFYAGFGFKKVGSSKAGGTTYPVMRREPKVKKEAGAAVDADPPASPAIIGPGFSWHKLPEQKQTAKKRPPKVILSGAPSNEVSLNQNVNKDSADEEATLDPDATGRPRWMTSPGYSGIDPQYASQKPDGNSDTLFAKNINKDPPPLIPIDPDSYYIW